MKRIAIIGAGPGGIVAAKFLKGQGFTPVLIEAHNRLGGQWAADNPNSGVWPMMRTNTARLMTRFSDLDYPDGTAIFPRNGEVRNYLQIYAEFFGLLDDAQFSTRVTGLAQVDDSYVVTTLRDGVERTETFARVVVASGPYNDPAIPDVPGLDAFTGTCGVIHAFDYDDPDRYRGKHVLVAGGNISSLEIASDLAMLGAASVTTTMRRQRYVMPKLIAGVPVECYGFTRAAALFQETASSEDWAAATKAFVMQYGGNPAWYGAPEPDADIRIAGTTGSQNFLNLVAEDRITCKPWCSSVAGRTVTFVDGSSLDVDAIIFGTGYRLHLPYLSDAISVTVELSAKSITLANHSFHPDLPGLAFMGLWGQIGPYLPPLEQQARYIAYTWGGAIAAPADSNLRSDLEACRLRRGGDIYQHMQTLHFARLTGCDPTHGIDDNMADTLANLPVTAVSCRLTGPDQLPDAAAQICADATHFGRRLT